MTIDDLRRAMREFDPFNPAYKAVDDAFRAAPSFLDRMLEKTRLYREREAAWFTERGVRPLTPTEAKIAHKVVVHVAGEPPFVASRGFVHRRGTLRDDRCWAGWRWTDTEIAADPDVFDVAFFRGSSAYSVVPTSELSNYRLFPLAALPLLAEWFLICEQEAGR